MGVVYKFKKEVMDFVLQQKKTDHDLGCRQLAILTSEKFKIQVSKSSINAIIKNANLSNSVGRPASEEPLPKKFQIPSQKKQQLLADVRKVKIEQKPLPVNVLPQPKQVPVVAPQRRGFFSRREPNGQATFLRHVESSRARRAQNKGVMREGMGCIFLKAAQWQLSRTSVLGGLLRKHISEPLPPSFDVFCDVLPCLSLLGVSEPSQIGRLTNHALWCLNGFDQPLSDLEISRWSSMIRAISPSVKFSLEYEKEKWQALMEAKRFELHLESGSRIFMDACLTGVGDENLPPPPGEEEAGFSACAQQAMTMLSHCVISNNRPAIFLSSARQRFFSSREPAGQAVLDIVAAFEGVEGKQFKKVVVFDNAEERIAEFSLFPRQKRFFMLGAWPWQDEFLLLSSATFSILSKNARMVEPFYDEVTDKIFYVTAGPAPIFQQELRAKKASLRSVAVLASPEGAPIMVILTNCEDKAPAGILQAFLRRWPNLDTGPAGGVLRAAGASEKIGNEPVCSLPTASAGKGSPDVLWPARLDASMVFQDWGDALNRYCQKHFWGAELSNFNIIQLISMLYSLPGHYVIQEQALLISLSPPAGYSCFNELQRVVQRVNEAGITDLLGRSLVINIIKYTI